MTRALVTLLFFSLAGVALAFQQPPEGMVLVPAGEFVMGADDSIYDEAPEHRVYVSAFYIDRYETTNAEFARFVREADAYESVEGPWFRYSAEGCLDLMRHFESRYGVTVDEFELEGAGSQSERLSHALRWRAAAVALDEMLGEVETAGAGVDALAARDDVRALIDAQSRLPVRGVAWRDARAYAQWAGKRLLTEAEWEKAARGAEGLRYPWGNEWDPARARAGLAPGNPDAGPAPVGSHPENVSPCGAFDMAGNVWEWVEDWYGENEYKVVAAASDEPVPTDPTGPVGLADGRLPGPTDSTSLLRSPLQGRENNTRKVIRGGGWSGPALQARFNCRTSRRLWSNPNYWHPDVGFRCGKDLP